MSTEHVAGPVARAFATFEAPVPNRCATCGSEFYGAACEGCADRAKVDAEAARILPEIDRHVVGFMTSAGLSPRELTARRDMVPPGLSKLLFQENAERIRSIMEPGAPRPLGFGLAGDTGTGKSFALAAVMMAGVYSRLRVRVAAEGRRALNEPWLTWVRWPESVTHSRGIAGQEGGLSRVESEMAALARRPWLVLDDLGAERFVGASYVEDWMASQLDLLVDRRYNAKLTTWYTTNLDQRGFVTRYGARLYSRLASESPMLKVPAVKDLRMGAR